MPSALGLVVQFNRIKIIMRAVHLQALCRTPLVRKNPQKLCKLQQSLGSHVYGFICLPYLYLGTVPSGDDWLLECSHAVASFSWSCIVSMHSSANLLHSTLSILVQVLIPKFCFLYCKTGMMCLSCWYCCILSNCQQFKARAQWFTNNGLRRPPCYCCCCCCWQCPPHTLQCNAAGCCFVAEGEKNFGHGV